MNEKKNGACLEPIQIRHNSWMFKSCKLVKIVENKLFADAQSCRVISNSLRAWYIFDLKKLENELRQAELFTEVGIR